MIGTAIAALAVWVVRNTYWAELTLPTSMRGDAARYPLYAAESLARQLGARTSRDNTFPSPATDAVIYLSDWTWDLGDNRRNLLESWVQSGGVWSWTAVYSRKPASSSGAESSCSCRAYSRGTKRRARGTGQVTATNGSNRHRALTGDPVKSHLPGVRPQSWKGCGHAPLIWAASDRDGMVALRSRLAGAE